jgi:xanthine dehydrogenase accessory factor
MIKDLQLWNFILDHLTLDQPVMLLVVAESEGSSPGRPGFKLALSVEGTIQGSIGGGIMEVKLVELGKKLLQNSHTDSFLKKQVHHKNTGRDQSGMICSGEQTVLYCMLTARDTSTVKSIIDIIESGSDGSLTISNNDESDLGVVRQKEMNVGHQLEKINEQKFRYSESLGYKAQLYIVGGGHCALALSELMVKLNFYVHVLDDRHDLNTMKQNHAAHSKKVIASYDQIADEIPSGAHVYVVIMTLGYRSDIQVLLNLKDKSFAYLGVLGSEAKVAAIRTELAQNNYPSILLEKMNAPIGLRIHSHSPEEIAVSIAAEIILHYNAK